MMNKTFGFAGEDGLQAKTLAVFTVFSTLRERWGGALIVSVGLGELGSAVALAANVAGAACLSIEPDAAACRAAMRVGACDFFVNTVDEALRVLKNEIRQDKPLSVALEVNTAAALEELLERGVLPQMFTAVGKDSVSSVILSAAQAFQEQGTVILDVEGTLGGVRNVVDGPGRLQTLLDEEGLTMDVVEFEAAAALREFDARVLRTLVDGDPRRAWLLAAPRLFHRDRPHRRAVLLTEAERAAIH